MRSAHECSVLDDFVIDLHIEYRLLGLYGNIVPKLHSSSKILSGGDTMRLGSSTKINRKSENTPKCSVAAENLTILGRLRTGI
jgi:hypothetical protein